MNEKDASQFSINPPEPSPGTKRVPAPPVGNVANEVPQAPAFENMILDACIAEFQAKKKRAFINLHNYLVNPAGVGEHGDIVSECVSLLKDLSEANDGLEAIREITGQK